MTQEELKPCPFCGSSDLAVMELLSRGFRIECAGCEAYSPVIKDGPSLLTAWNTRASDAHPNAADYRNRAERAEAELAEVRDAIRIAARWFEQAAINHEIAAEVSGPNENAAYVEAARRDTYRGKFLRAALNGGKHD